MENDNEQTHPIMGLVQDLEGLVRKYKAERDDWKARHDQLLMLGTNPIPIAIAFCVGGSTGAFLIWLWMHYGS